MPSSVSCPVFVGRQEELRLLREAVSRAAVDVPSVVLVGGEAGVGKTRLLVEVSEHARRDHDATVLVGGCLDLGEASLPYAPLVEALRDLARRLGTDRLRAVLGPARRTLAPLIPDLDRSASLQPAEAAGDGNSQAVLFEAVLGVLGRLGAEGPVVLALEDLHWAESATLDLLVFLANNLRSERVALIATFRSDELHRRHPLRPVLSELVRLPTVERLEVPRFGRKELIEQATAILDGPPDERFVDDVLVRSEGNPFYAEELLALAVADADAGTLPDTLREILIDRVAALPQATLDVLRIAAAVGRDVDDRLLSEIADLPADELRTGLRDALAHQVLVAGGAGETLHFRHALLQEAVHDDLLPSERTALHAAVAAALERRPDLASGGPDAVHGELAHHWSAAHDLPRAFTASVAAASHAYGVYAFTEAQRHYERALALWDRVPEVREATIERSDLLSRAAAAASNAGDIRRALTHQRAAIEALDAGASRDTRARLVAQLSVMQWLSGHGEEALAVIDDALADFPSEASRGRARLLERRGRLLMLGSRHPDAVEVAGEAAEMARTVGLRRIEGRALNTLGFSLASSGEEEAGMAHLRTALDIALELEDVASVSAAYANLSEILADAGRFDESYELAMAGVRWFEERGTTGPVPHFIRLNAVLALYWLGRWDEAGELFGSVAPPYGQNVTTIFHACTGALLRTAQGRFAEARRHVDDGLALTRDADDPQFIAPLATAEMELACWQGRPLEAEDALRRALDLAEQDPWWIKVFLPVAARNRADVVATTDDPGVASRARATLLDLLDRARQVHAEIPDGTSHELRMRAAIATAEAELTRLDGDPDPAAWRRAVETTDATGVVHPTAYARWRLAEALLRSDGDRDAAAAELAAAHRTATDLGAVPLGEEIEALARRARIALPGVSAADDAGLGLTPREREVLTLVSAGRTNREIGKALFIAEKTASVHVSNILAKLGVATRGEAAAVAHRFGLNERTGSDAAR